MKRKPLRSCKSLSYCVDHSEKDSFQGSEEREKNNAIIHAQDNENLNPERKGEKRQIKVN